MIADISGRYLLAANSHELSRYDRRWRRTTRVSPYNGEEFRIVEGKHHLLSIRERLGELAVQVRSAESPEHVIAEGRFAEDKWQFTGDNQAWSLVPEYLLVTAEALGITPDTEADETAVREGVDGEEAPEAKDEDEDEGDEADFASRHALLRLADDSVPQLLENKDVAAVVAIPDSRLVVLQGGGLLSVYDPIAQRPVAQFRFTDSAERPSMEFRNPDELWVNDSTSLMKVDSRAWSVSDAAGSTERIVSWSFAEEESLCCVVNDDATAVVVRTEDMMAVSQCQFLRSVDQAIYFSTSDIVGFSAETSAFYRARKAHVLAVSSGDG